MTDVGTGLTVLGSALGSVKIIEKILGPTADYLGQGIRDWTQKSVNNVGVVFKKAANKLGERIDQPGTVPPRVLKGILQEAPFCDDELSAEYFGGILASSRSLVPRDDRATALISLISRMTTYQIHSHFIFYSIFKTLYDGQNLSATSPEHRDKMQTFVPVRIFMEALSVSADENPDLIWPHVMFGLNKEGLIDDNFFIGNPDSLRKVHYTVETDGIVIRPSALGTELLLAAHGYADLTIPEFLSSECSLPSLAGVSIPDGSRHIDLG